MANTARVPRVLGFYIQFRLADYYVRLYLISSSLIGGLSKN